jgi:hypothetical protein
VAVPGTLLCRITLAALDGSDDNDNSNVVVDVKSCASRDARDENTNGERKTVNCMILRFLCAHENTIHQFIECAVELSMGAVV